MARTKARANGQHTGYYRDVNGKERSAGTCATKTAARQLAQAEEDKIRRGTWTDPSAGNITFTDYFETEWIIHRTLEINGREYYWSNYRAGLKAKFGKMPLLRIKHPMIQTWITEMIAAGVKPRTIKARLATLQVVLAAKEGKSAINDSLIPDINPCARVTTPPIPKHDVQIYTPDQVDELIAALDPWWRLLVWFDSETGLRWGELIAVRVCDIDFLRRRLVVARTVIETARRNTGNGTPYMIKEYTKEEDIRIVGLSQETIDMIAEHVKVRGLGPEDPLFSKPVLRVLGSGRRILTHEVERTAVWPNGVPVGRSYFADVWITAIKKAGVPYRRRHDLRASFISWLLDDPNLSPQHVMDIVGHVNWSTTKRYAKSLDRVHELGVEAIKGVRQRHQAG